MAFPTTALTSAVPLSALAVASPPVTTRPLPTGPIPDTAKACADAGAHCAQYVPGQALVQRGTVSFSVLPETLPPAGGAGLAGTAPDIVRLADGRYRMYHQIATGRGNASIPWVIVSSTSTDAVHWSADPGVRIVPGPAPTSPDFLLQYPSVVMGLDGQWKMVYQGRPDRALPGKFRLFFAVSDDGLAWTKLPAAFGEGPNGGTAAHGILAVIDGHYELYYGTTYQLRRAESSDLVTWQVMGDATPFGTDPGGEILHTGDAYYMFLDAWTDDPAPTVEDPVAMFMLASRDGIHWSSDAYRVMATFPDGTVSDLNALKYGFQGGATIGPDGGVLLYHSSSSKADGLMGMTLRSPLPRPD